MDMDADLPLIISSTRMTMMMRVVISLLLLLLCQEASGFAPFRQPRRIVSICASDSNENQQPSSPKQKQERILEQLSRDGASQIASLDVHERAKRAMLAEAIEDRIMDNIEVLEHLVSQKKNESSLSRAKALAQETKVLQVQYEELVSGKPSSVLQSLEAAMGNNDKEEGDEE